MQERRREKEEKIRREENERGERRGKKERRNRDGRENGERREREARGKGEEARGERHSTERRRIGIVRKLIYVGPLSVTCIVKFLGVLLEVCRRKSRIS